MRTLTSRLRLTSALAVGLAFATVAEAHAQEPEATPVEPTPVEPTPVEPAPVEPTPVEPTPVEPTPVESAPVEPAPAAEEWTFAIHGFVAGYLQTALCDKSTTVVAGGAACQVGPDGAPRSAISNGLGVGSFGVTASTVRGDWELGGTTEIWSGLNSIPAKVGFGETAPSMRQSFVSFGTKKLGTFKVGRMFGVFGSAGIGNDMTLSGVGSGGAGVSGAGNSTNGRIGVGYVFADFFPQIQYTSPSASGFEVVIAAIQAFDAAPIAGINPITLVEHPLPGAQAKLGYSWDGDVAGGASIGGMVQRAQGAAGQDKVNSVGVDLGARVDVGGVQIVAYAFIGEGLGFYAPLRDGVALVDGRAAKRTSKGGFGQVTYKVGELKLGASYGGSWLDAASAELDAETLVASNTSIIAGLYYSLGGVVTLTGEYTHTIAENQSGDSISENSIALGASAGF